MRYIVNRDFTIQAQGLRNVSTLCGSSSGNVYKYLYKMQDYINT